MRQQKESEAMSDIVPAAPGFRICYPDNGFGRHGRHIQIDILAWQISPTGDVVPITAFGLVDVSAGYVLGMPGDAFAVLPNGPFLHEYNQVTAHLAKGGAA
jgi:hypothetical protein